MRENWLSNRVFKSHDDILDHCCQAWNNLSRFTTGASALFSLIDWRRDGASAQTSIAATQQAPTSTRSWKRLSTIRLPKPERAPGRTTVDGKHHESPPPERPLRRRPLLPDQRRRVAKLARRKRCHRP